MKETVFDTIQIHFNTHEELKQFMEFLEDQGVPRQTGISNIKDVIPFPVFYKNCKY